MLIFLNLLEDDCVLKCSVIKNFKRILFDNFPQFRKSPFFAVVEKCGFCYLMLVDISSELELEVVKLKVCQL